MRITDSDEVFQILYVESKWLKSPELNNIMPVERSAGAIIFRNIPAGREYLLLHYSGSTEKGFWDFPKGHIEKGETTEETVRREVKEETCLDNIEIVPGFKETIRYFVKVDGKNRLKFVAFFLAKTAQERVKISPEHQGYKWLPYDKAHKTVTYKNAKEVLKKAHNFPAGKSI